MSITLMSLAVQQKSETTTGSKLLTLSDHVVCAVILAGISENHTLCVSNDTIENVQDELLLLDRSSPYFKILVTHMSTICITEGNFTVSPLARHILTNSFSSRDKSLGEGMFAYSDFDPKAFTESVMRRLFDASEIDYMDASLSAGANILLKKSGGERDAMCKLSFDPKLPKCTLCRGECREVLTPLEATQIRDFLLVSTTSMRSAEYADLGYARMSYALQNSGRLRVTIGTQRNHPDFSIRKIPTTPIPLDRFYLSQAIRDWLLTKRQGIHLVVGSPSSGKTALLASLLTDYTQRPRYKITTFESPIEYTFRHGCGIVNQIELGVDIKDIREALVKLRTDDPDILMITEIRSVEDMRCMIEAANLGICVFSTYHAADIESVFGAVAGMFADDISMQEMFSKNIRTIIHQSLIAKKSGGVTPVHSVLMIEDDMHFDIPFNPRSIRGTQQRIDTVNKFSLNDIYNLFLNGVIAEDVYKLYSIEDNMSFDAMCYPEGSQNAATMVRL